MRQGISLEPVTAYVIMRRSHFCFALYVTIEFGLYLHELASEDNEPHFGEYIFSLANVQRVVSTGS